MTASLIDVFGSTLELGRWYTEQEDQFIGPAVVVLSHGVWMQRFNGDRSVIGRSLMMDGKAYEVIGVVPESFNLGRGDVYVPI